MTLSHPPLHPLPSREGIFAETRLQSSKVNLWTRAGPSVAHESDEMLY
jgi:hypothetical protein